MHLDNIKKILHSPPGDVNKIPRKMPAPKLPDVLAVSQARRPSRRKRAGSDSRCFHPVFACIGKPASVEKEGAVTPQQQAWRRAVGIGVGPADIEERQSHNLSE